MARPKRVWLSKKISHEWSSPNSWPCWSARSWNGQVIVTGNRDCCYVYQSLGDYHQFSFQVMCAMKTRMWWSMSCLKMIRAPPHQAVMEAAPLPVTSFQLWLRNHAYLLTWTPPTSQWVCHCRAFVFYRIIVCCVCASVTFVCLLVRLLSCSILKHSNIIELYCGIKLGLAMFISYLTPFLLSDRNIQFWSPEE